MSEHKGDDMPTGDYGDLRAKAERYEGHYGAVRALMARARPDSNGRHSASKAQDSGLPVGGTQSRGRRVDAIVHVLRDIESGVYRPAAVGVVEGLADLLQRELAAAAERAAI